MGGFNLVAELARGRRWSGISHLVYKLAVNRLVVYKFVFYNVSGNLERPLPSELEKKIM